MRQQWQGLRAVSCAWALAGVTSCGGGGAATATGRMQQDTIVAVQLALIGELEGSDEYVFGDITSVAVGPLGHVYAADRLGSIVRAFDTSGRFVSTIGSEGEGPGEFFWPSDLTFDPEGRLYVRDASRITVLAKRASGIVPDSLVRTIPQPGGVESTRSRTDGELYYYPDARYGEQNRYFYQVFDSAGPTGDTVHVPQLPTMAFLPTALFRLGETDGRLVEGVNRAPFEPAASWDITARGSIIVARGDRYEILEVTSAHDTIRVVRMPIDLLPVPEDEARDSARAFQARLDAIPVSLDRVVRMSDAARNARLPETLPAILAVHVAADQTWVRRWPTNAGQTVFDVIDADGALLHTVVVPAPLLHDPPPFVSPEVVVGVVRDSDTDVERVAVFSIASK